MLSLNRSLRESFVSYASQERRAPQGCAGSDCRSSWFAPDLAAHAFHAQRAAPAHRQSQLISSRIAQINKPPSISMENRLRSTPRITISFNLSS